MNKQENQLLKKMQSSELDILKQFINVCNKLDINYFLIGGTLIGAVRHKGFIPWDDDIDVCMLRKDYDIFLKEGQKYLDDNYFLQTYETDKNYPNCYAKIRNSKTTFLEKSVSNIYMNHGVFIDIFPLDNYYKYNKLKAKLIQYAIYGLYGDFYKNSNSFFKRVVANIAEIMYGRKSKIILCKKLEAIYTKANNSKCDKVSNYSGAWGVQKETHFLEDFSDYKFLDFEDIKAKVPVGYDRCLRDTYGEYMTLPPIEKRVSHHDSDIIDLQNSYKKYLKKII